MTAMSRRGPRKGGLERNSPRVTRGESSKTKFARQTFTQYAQNPVYAQSREEKLHRPCVPQEFHLGTNELTSCNIPCTKRTVPF